ncbi:TPA: LysR family transcriptional regulator [Streptococcus suis]|nr:LysR family transcriptional regulator [Streptococcus suis]
MDINRLKEFVQLAKTGNYLEAAENLFISQSSLSKHILSLEKELDILLFDRTTRRVKLTDAGRILLKYAEEMLAIDYQWQTALLNLKDTSQQKLDIGTIPIMSAYGITDLISEYKKENPKTQLMVFEGETSLLKERVLAGQSELAFIRRVFPTTEKADSELFSIRNFTRDYLVAVLPSEHTLANQDFIHLSELRNENFLFLHQQSILHQISLNACRAAGFEPNIVYSGKRAENIVDLVAKGMGISLLMSKPVAYLNTSNDIKLIPVSPYIETEIAIYTKKGVKLSAAAQHFLQFSQNR